MTERARKFCEYYAASGNGCDAAKKAGYSERSARTQASRLLQDPEIIAEIKRLQEASRSERIADSEEVKTLLSSLMRDAEQRTNARLRAADMLLKAGGDYLRPVEDPSTATEEESGSGVIIQLPWNGWSYFNAYETESGEIRRFQPWKDNVLIYLSRDQQELISAALECYEAGSLSAALSEFSELMEELRNADREE